MAKLPVYHSQGGITTDTPNNIRRLDANNGFGDALGAVSKQIVELGEKWQAAKDEVENLDGKNKLMMGVQDVLTEAQQFNTWTNAKDLDAKKQELTAKMNSLTPDVMQGFSNNRNAGIFQRNAEYIVYQNQAKLDQIFRDKYQDMALGSLATSQNTNYNNFILTGNDSYKKIYFADIDKMVSAGFLTREDAAKNKLEANKWNADYAYNVISKNPYAKIPDNIMQGIDGKQQASIRNFARSEQKRIKADNLLNLQETFFLNPTQDNLDKLKKAYVKNHPMTNLDELQDLVDKQNNFDSYSNVSGLEEATKGVQELANIDTSTQNGKMEYIAKAGILATSILKNNTAKDGTSSISNADKNKLITTIYKNMGDATFKEQLRGLPDLSGLKSIELWRNYYKKRRTDTATNVLKAEEQARNFDLKDSLVTDAAIALKLDSIKKQTMTGVLDSFVKGDVKTAGKIYQAGLEAAIKTKYYYIPELQKPDLQVGQKFTINGKVYSFQGFSNKDIIVEMH
jgi:hypothetical protein